MAENDNLDLSQEELNDNIGNSAKPSDNDENNDDVPQVDKQQEKQWYEAEIYGAPDDYDFKDVKLPEGMVLADETTTQFKQLAKESNLSQAQADKYLQLAVSHSQYIQNKFNEAVKFQHEQQIQKWDSDCENSDDLKGSKYDEAVRVANLALDKLVPENSDFKDVLKQSGLNHHPVIIRAFKLLGEQMQSPQINNGSYSSQSKSFAEELYPYMNKN